MLQQNQLIGRVYIYNIYVMYYMMGIFRVSQMSKFFEMTRKFEKCEK